MATTTTKNKASTPKTTVKTKPTVNYTFNPQKESASQYNARVAKERGDSSSELKSMQKATDTAYKAKGLDYTSTIDSSKLKQNEPWVAPTPVTPTDVGNLAGAGNAGVATGMSDYKLNPQTGMFDPMKLDPSGALKYAMDNQPKQPNTEEMYYKSKEYKNLTRAQQEVNNGVAQLNQITAQRDAQVLGLEGTGRGQTTGFIGGEQARINREAAIAALPIQAQVAAAQGNLEFAQKQLDTVMTLRMQDAQNEYKYQTDKLNTIVSFLDKAETRKYNERQTQLGQEFQMKMEGIKFDHDKQLKQLTDSYGVPSVGDGQYSGIVQTILGSGKFTNQQARAISNAINNGEDPVTVIRNNAKGLLSSTQADKITNLEIAQKALRDIDTNLKQFYANGGSTNIFSGTYEKVINKLGEVNNPNLVELATQIQSNLQVYRNAVSGTAYSEQEGADIATIFPGINKTQGLNQAIISGRMKSFDSTIDAAYSSVLGSAYNSLVKETSSQQTVEDTTPEGIFNTTVFGTANSTSNTNSGRGILSSIWDWLTN